MKRLKMRIFLIILSVMLCSQTVFGAQLVVPGGQVVGLEIADDTVTVAAFDEDLGKAAKACGLKIGDRIVSVNGKEVRSAQDIRTALEKSDGKIELSVLRNSKALKLEMEPAVTPNGPKLGVYLKQGITGVGTVTWYDPESGRFGALGHSVNKPDGTMVQMHEGNVYTASVVAVKAGKAGAPGQLMSTVTGGNIVGSLTQNTQQGVFGTAQLPSTEEKLPLGSKEQIHTGSAVIRSTVSGDRVQEYSVEILKVYPHSGAGGRNMLLKVTDPELLSTTGGIVQGMSGSPIIQDGKLIGAVTHVLVNDPQTGYGIFIENMLEAAS